MERDGATGDGEGEQLTRGGGWTGEEEEEKGKLRASARRDGDGGDGEGYGVKHQNDTIAWIASRRRWLNRSTNLAGLTPKSEMGRPDSRKKLREDKIHERICRPDRERSLKMGEWWEPLNLSSNTMIGIDNVIT
ncbi:hypothetical protein Droror1_Dr00008604 [Drosera rotundifolia]